MKRFLYIQSGTGRVVLLASVFIHWFISSSLAQQDYDMDAEIHRLTKEISRISSERASVKDASAKDRTEFNIYKENISKRKMILAAENDSIRAATAVLNSNTDSLKRALSNTVSKSGEIELASAHLRSVLVSVCEKCMIFTSLLPPSIAGQYSSSLSFLKSELSAKTAENIEALNRLFVILDDIESALMDIQITHGPSPLPLVPGNCYRLRIGGVFEALVDEKNQKSAVWNPDTEGNWQISEDPGIAELIKKAISVREGKTMPVMVELPFSDFTEKDR